MLNKKLSIIIVNYKSADFLEKCVALVREKISEEFLEEIIIVNNDQEEAIKLNFQDNLKIINNSKNVGFGAGNNAGAKVAKGDVILFLNPDTEIISKNIEDIFSLFQQDEKLGVIGSQLWLDDNRVQPWSAGHEINLINLIKNNLGLVKSQKIWKAEEEKMVDWVAGTALFIRKDIFEKIGGFDEKFFMYFEDMDLCKRVREAGKNILYNPNFKVKHIGGKSYQEKGFQKRDYYASQEYYFKKHRNFFEWLIVKMANKLFYL
ncbi:MAG: glycosyltransferase family 2 protein [Parcubacteria group bacterium]|jgi:hypothetical protein